MTANAEVARERTPLVSKVDLFDSLMTISFLTKALANQVLHDASEKEGGKENGKETFNFSSK